MVHPSNLLFTKAEYAGATATWHVLGTSCYRSAFGVSGVSGNSSVIGCSSYCWCSAGTLKDDSHGSFPYSFVRISITFERSSIIL